MSPSNSNHTQWGYGHHNGPEEWSKLYETGTHQSPIDIQFEQFACCSFGCNKQLTCCSKLAITSNKEQHLGSLCGKRRTHLDSTGDESQKSSPIASSTSSEHQSLGSVCVIGNTSDDSDDNGHVIDDNLTRCNCNKTFDKQKNVRLCATNKKIFLGYPRYIGSMQLCNTGHNWQINLPKELAAHTLLAGPAFGNREYRLLQFHCHWGEDCNHGSEHLINGKGYAAEIHFVHWNYTEFWSAEEASRNKHGLAVLAVMIQALEGEQYRNKHLDKVIKNLSKVEQAGSSVQIDARLDLKKLFPTNRFNYATYEGSLTTPPLSEVVDWLVFLNPIQCSTSQIEQFRSIKCSHGGKQDKLIKNCRPIQPLNERVVSVWTHH